MSKRQPSKIVSLADRVTGKAATRLKEVAQQYQEATQRAAQLVQEHGAVVLQAKQAEAVLNELVRQVWEEHGMVAGDKVNPLTGEILRVAAAVKSPVVKP